MPLTVVAIGNNVKEITATLDAHSEIAPDIVLFDAVVAIKFPPEVTAEIIHRYGKQSVPIILLAPRACNNLLDGLEVQAQDFIITGKWNRAIKNNLGGIKEKDSHNYPNEFQDDANPKLWANITDQALEEKLNHWIALSRNGFQPERDLLSKRSTQKRLGTGCYPCDYGNLHDALNNMESIEEKLNEHMPLKYLQSVHVYAHSLLSVTEWGELRKAIVDLADGLGINIGIVSHDTEHRFSSQHDWFGHFEAEWLYYKIYQIHRGYNRPRTLDLGGALMDHRQSVSMLYGSKKYSGFAERYWKVALKIITSMTQLTVDKLLAHKHAT